jgi:hypothetical protein
MMQGCRKINIPVLLHLISRRWVWTFVLLVFLASCHHDIEVITPNNEAIPDLTIEDVTITDYVNRVYISVLGREADSTEKQFGFSILRQNNLSAASRSQFLDSIFYKPEYKVHLYDLARIDLLNNLDTADIVGEIFLFNFLLSDTAYQFYWPQLQAEIIRLDSLKAIPSDLQNNVIDVTGMHRRCVNNYFYDQINAGTENFVVSVFQHFLLRYPTASELQQSKQMVDGFPSILFLQSGQTKNDFIRIFFDASDYYEGLVRMLYQRFLFRTPTSVEMGNATVSFLQNHDFILMQKNILSTNEYIGIH